MTDPTPQPLTPTVYQKTSFWDKQLKNKIGIPIMVGIFIFTLCLGGIGSNSTAQENKELKKANSSLKQETRVTEDKLGKAEKTIVELQAENKQQIDSSACRVSTLEALQLVIDYHSLVQTIIDTTLEVINGRANDSAINAMVAKGQSTFERLSPLAMKAVACDPSIGDKLDMGALSVR